MRHDEDMTRFPTTVTLIGGPTTVIDYAGVRLLTDPTFDPPGDYPGGGVGLHKLTGPALGPDEIGDVDVVLLSHDQHPDNLDAAGRAYLPRVGTVLSTLEAAARIDGVTGLAAWETHTVGDVEITGLPARHGPVGCEPMSGAVTGFLLRAPDAPTVYVSGDNAAVEIVQQIVDRVGPLDVALLFAGAANVGRFGDEDMTLNARTAVEAARVLGDAVIVPVHAEGWHHFSETRERLVREFGLAGLAGRLRVPTAGEKLTL
jgi:L-ascorbate metabolism protein UlaG (beta-lactamase superfamily)